MVHPNRAGHGIVPMPVMATFDANTEGNWIAHRIVKRLRLKYQQDSAHKEVPSFEGESYTRTRIFVELICGKQKKSHKCHHRFYVVNYYKPDLLLGSEFCS